MEKALITKIGRWTVTADGIFQSQHNEEKESYESAIWIKYNNPSLPVLIMPPGMEITLSGSEPPPELLTEGENIEVTT